MIISLDQNVVSSLEGSSKVALAWSKIKALLVAGTIARKVVCPIPYETAWESVPLSDGRYERIKKLQTDLFLGLSFKAYVRLLSEEVLALVRPDLDLDPFELGNWHDLCDHVRRAAPRDEFRKLKENVTQQMAASPVIYENQALPTAELENVVHKKDSFDLYNNLERMRTEQILAPTCAYTADICRYLQHNNISLDEIQHLKQLVLQHKYKSIPIHFYHNRLLTQFEFDLLHGGRRGEANDMDDLTRAATALWAAQIYVCDAEMAELCKKAKIREIQAVPTIVFSARQPDLLLQHLESILESSSS